MNRLLRPCLFAATLAVAPLAAQGSVLPYLPHGTVFALETPDLKTSIADYANSPFAKIWAEAEVQAFVKDALQMAQTKIDEGLNQAREQFKQGMLPVDPDQVLKIRLNGATVALTSVALRQGDFQPVPHIGLIVHLDFGDSAKIVHGLVQMGLAMLTQQAGAQVEQKQTKVGDHTILSYMPTTPEAGEMGLNVVMTPNGLLVGTLTGEVKSVLENMAAKKMDLGAAADYTTCKQRLNSQGVECEMFMRTGPLFDFTVQALTVAKSMGALEQVDPTGVERAITALGLRGLQAMGATCTLEDGKWIGKSFTSMPKAARQGLTAMTAGKLDMGFLKWVPKNAVSVSGTVLGDMTQVYDAFEGALKAYDPKFADEVLKQFAAMQEQVGVKVRDDLFASLGDTYISWSLPMAGMMSPPEQVHMVKVKDEKKIVEVVKNLAKLSEGLVEVTESEKRGLKSYSIRINFDPTGGAGGGMNPLDMLGEPTFSFKDGWMVIGMAAGDIKRAFARMEREDDPAGDIRSNKEFAPYLQQIPADVQSMSFTDLKGTVEGLYQMVTMALGVLPPSDEIPIDMNMLPEAQTITKHLFGFLSYTQDTPDGSVGHFVSPVGPEVLAALGIGVGAAIFVGTQMR